MGTIRAWASRVWVHVATLLEKPNVPGAMPLTVPALAIVAGMLLYLLFS